MTKPFGEKRIFARRNSIALCGNKPKSPIVDQTRKGQFFFSLLFLWWQNADSLEESVYLRVNLIHRQNFTISGHSKLCSWGVYLSPQISAGHRKATTRSHSTYSTTCITRLLTLSLRDFVLAKPAYESLVTSHVRDQVMVTPVFVVEISWALVS